MDDDPRASTIRQFERYAEMLTVHHLDLLAQIEAQLRAVHHTMRRIERLRGAKHRVGLELTNGQRQTTLSALSDEVTDLDSQLSAEHDGCAMMQATITKMKTLVLDLRHIAAELDARTRAEPSVEDRSPSAGE